MKAALIWDNGCVTTPEKGPRRNVANPPTPSPCLVCGKTLTALKDGEPQPEEAVSFRASPGYGSDFDGTLGELEINVCDGCLVERRDRVTHLSVVREVRTMRWTWQPELLS